MNVTLAPDSEQYLREQVAAGKFPSADAAISEALRRMRDYELKLDELRRDIAVGIEQADQNLTSVFTAATVERIKSQARQHASP